MSAGANSPAEFVYRVGWRPQGLRPGAHTSRRSGMGQLFSGYASLLDHPDPRRLDLRASVRDPFGMLYTRVYRQRAAIRVLVVADLSSSMRFGDKARFLADFVDAAARSAFGVGDAFGFVGIGAGHAARTRWYRPPSFRRGVAHELVDRLGPRPPLGRGLSGLDRLPEQLPRQRALVFLVSDFHWPAAELEAALGALARHDVIPVVLWHPREYSDLPQRGLVSLQDPETGRRRTLLMRPRLAERLRAAYASRRETLTRRFLRAGRPPFFAGLHFDAGALTDYFLRAA